MPERALTHEGQAGLAYVATASFLASRILPTGGFVAALAGGTALARVGQRAGLRRGYGASLAAMLQTVAIMGPARIGVPLTQALSAPLLGSMFGRGLGTGPRFAVCAVIRATDQVAATAFFIWVIVGGLDAYAGSYNAFLGRLLPEGAVPALVATGMGLALWTVFASAVQVAVYDQGLRRWPQPAEAEVAAGRAEPTVAAGRAEPTVAAGHAEPTVAAGRADPTVAACRAQPTVGAEPAQPTGAAGAGEQTGAHPPMAPRFDPRAVALAAAIAFVVLVADLSWPVLGAVGAWLAVAWLAARAEREPVRAGLVLAALLAASALSFGIFGGIDVDEIARRTLRAALLVLVATWLRAAAGEEGLREVARRLLGRVRRVPAMREAASTLDALGAPRGLEASARALGRQLGQVPRRLAPLADAVLRWAAGEAARFRPAPPSAPRRLRLAARDLALVLAAVLAALAGLVP
jgi:hypothetical protein